MALSSEGQLAIGEGSKLGNERRLRCDHVQFPEHSQYTMSRGNYLEPLLTTVHQIGLGENPISQALNHVSHSQLRAMLLVVSEVRRPHSSLHARSVWRRLPTKARAAGAYSLGRSHLLPSFGDVGRCSSICSATKERTTARSRWT
jgi:hypothetical protein